MLCEGADSPSKLSNASRLDTAYLFEDHPTQRVDLPIKFEDTTRIVQMQPRDLTV